eukprot:10699411-Heterocapsa_arctica.AAC.1
MEGMRRLRRSNVHLVLQHVVVHPSAVAIPFRWTRNCRENVRGYRLSHGPAFVLCMTVRSSPEEPQRGSPERAQ